MTDRLTTKQSPKTGLSLAGALLANLKATSVVIEKLPGLEEFITSPEWCGFQKASRIQRALMQAADGLQPDLTPRELEFHFGSRDFTNPGRPLVMLVRSGVRSAKSLIAACALDYNTLTADCSVARKTELLKGFVAAPLMRQTRATFTHVKGAFYEGDRMARFLDGEPNKEDMIVRRPDGRLVELSIVAAAPDAGNLRSTWVPGAIISEADLFGPDEDAAVNLQDQITGLRPRMLPGGQIWIESSPIAEEGAFYKMFQRYFGKPADGVLVFHADSFSMFPTMDRGGERQLRAIDPDKADREFFAVPSSTAGTEFFPDVAIQMCINRARPLHLSPVSGMPHWGGVDTGFKKNSSALALARAVGGKAVLAYHEELKPLPNKPLIGSDVCSRFARKALEYFCRAVHGDQHEEEIAVHEFSKHTDTRGDGVAYVASQPSQASNAEMFTEFRRRLLEGLLELPDDPALIAQLQKTKSQPGQNGGIKMVLPTKGHTHGDVLSSVVRAMVQVPLLNGTEDNDWGTPVNDSRWGDGVGRGF